MACGVEKIFPIMSAQDPYRIAPFYYKHITKDLFTPQRADYFALRGLSSLASA